MLYLLRAIYYLASAVSLFACLATTASMFIAERAPQSPLYWLITGAVSLFFAFLALLILGITRQLAAIGVLSRAMVDERGAALRARWKRLAVYLVLGGLILLSVLLIVTYAIVARIDQGFAVFG